MRLKYIFLFFISVIFLPTFCMKNKAQGIKNFPRGEKVYSNVLQYIRNQESQEDQEKAIERTASNLVDFSLHKAEHSLGEISEELKDIPVLGSIVNLPGISYFTNRMTSFFISRFIDFEAALKKKTDIKSCMQEVLKKAASCQEKELQEMEEEKHHCSYIWTEKELEPCKPEKKSEQEMLVDILCTVVVIAKNNKKMFKQFLKMGKVNEKYQDFFYQKLALSEDLEDKIKKSCLRESDIMYGCEEMVIPDAPQQQEGELQMVDQEAPGEDVFPEEDKQVLEGDKAGGDENSSEEQQEGVCILM